VVYKPPTLYGISAESDGVCMIDVEKRQPHKLSFLQVCAKVNFTPTGLACIAGVSVWIIYAMLDRQPVPQKRAEQVLTTLTQFSGQDIAYTLQTVDVVVEEAQ
jgi:hypothetical protein